MISLTGLPRSLRAALGACVLSLSAASAMACSRACSRAGAPPSDMRVECSIAPNPPTVGPATVDVGLMDAAGNPVRAARVRVEGTMSHPGMVPSIALADEVQPGRYRATLDFTMAGDWVVVVEATAPGHQSAERTIAVSSVRPQ